MSRRKARSDQSLTFSELPKGIVYWFAVWVTLLLIYVVTAVTLIDVSEPVNETNSNMRIFVCVPPICVR